LHDEIARLREDVRVLRRRSAPHGQSASRGVVRFVDRPPDYDDYDDYDYDDDELTDWSRRQLYESQTSANHIAGRRRRSSPGKR